jgi:hypothetical protein
LIPISEVLSMPEAAGKLDQGLKLYFGNQHLQGATVRLGDRVRVSHRWHHHRSRAPRDHREGIGREIRVLS